MKKQSNIFQTKEQNKTSEKSLNEMKTSNLPDKKFKVMVIKILSELGKGKDEYSGTFNKEMEKIRKYIK